MPIRECASGDTAAIYRIINEAARAYQGVIPDDRWHDPYMTMDELEAQLREGVIFWGYESDAELIGVMGLQHKGEVDLIRHAYVVTAARDRGVGTQLLRHLERQAEKPILIGTWASASWAIRFYEKNGYRVLSRNDTHALLKRYWDIPDRQVATSVVLASRTWERPS